MRALKVVAGEFERGRGAIDQEKLWLFIYLLASTNRPKEVGLRYLKIKNGEINFMKGFNYFTEGFAVVWISKRTGNAYSIQSLKNQKGSFSLDDLTQIPNTFLISLINEL